jgi:hypothetical protein
MFLGSGGGGMDFRKAFRTGLACGLGTRRKPLFVFSHGQPIPSTRLMTFVLFVKIRQRFPKFN